jgi:hypothetical protein
MDLFLPLGGRSQVSGVTVLYDILTDNRKRLSVRLWENKSQHW